MVCHTTYAKKSGWKELNKFKEDWSERLNEIDLIPENGFTKTVLSSAKYFGNSSTYESEDPEAYVRQLKIKKSYSSASKLRW